MTIHRGEEPDRWAIVELLGHVRMAGKLTTDETFGAKLPRIDIPGPPDAEGNETWVTQWFGTGSVYRITACTEATAREVMNIRSPSRVESYDFSSRRVPYELSSVSAVAGTPADASPYYAHEVDDDPGGAVADEEWEDDEE